MGSATANPGYERARGLRPGAARFEEDRRLSSLKIKSPQGSYQSKSETSPPVTRSAPTTVTSKSFARHTRAASCPGVSTDAEFEAIRKAYQSIVDSCSGYPHQVGVKEPAEDKDSEQTSTMKGEKKENDKSRNKSRRSSRAHSILSIASSYFGPMGSDISLDQQVSPAYRSSHVFFSTDSSPNRSVLSPSQFYLPEFTSPTGSVALGQEPDLQSLSSQINPSPPAPSRAPSDQLNDPIAPGATSPTPSTPSPASPTGRRGSKLSSISSLLPSFSGNRRKSLAAFFQNAKDIPSRLFKKVSKDKSPSPPPLRSTFKFKEEDTMPPKKRRMTSHKKWMLKGEKKAKKQVRKDIRRRARKYRRDEKRRWDETPEAKEARQWMSKTQRLLKVMDSAKEKFWEWVDKREENVRRTRARAYSAMRKERRQSVVLAPVDREYDAWNFSGKPEGLWHSR
ncbi:hypothetical protein TWF718_010843 [Orbilia javanica]|uniref:Uncharacterized protein n=1 Tax=Orbilia javanica TaxID=47235 RepID=A0AAN8MGE8_9PEZI